MLFSVPYPKETINTIKKSKVLVSLHFHVLFLLISCPVLLRLGPPRPAVLALPGMKMPCPRNSGGEAQWSVLTSPAGDPDAMTFRNLSSRGTDYSQPLIRGTLGWVCFPVCKIGRQEALAKDFSAVRLCSCMRYDLEVEHLISEAVLRELLKP